MKKKLMFYFDMMSPFSYLAHVKLPDMVKKYGYELQYHPMDIPRAKKAAGNYGPSNLEIPPKIKALKTDLMRWADRYAVPLNFPKNLKVQPWNVGALYAKKKGQLKEYVDEGYRRIWGEGCDPTEQSELEGLASTLGWNTDEFIQYINSPDAIKNFEQSCTEAENNGVFGAPIMMLDEQVWWGNDRLMFIEEYLQQKTT
ncbi:MAG TPA: 2-hydroxychromene-2-carboxylate isomerase [Thiotrichaceae bacterium]|jgi:2-hydroxychromene-2-carboxylate isomerase|nr:2-hydroxychromene-2-carboxylate isomerase [Thiotrichaceae bacterium]HIM08032.1 2-hydroxychromene-2-carboxylate isomerase [Gammaproteobacteria bacterium]